MLILGDTKNQCFKLKRKIKRLGRGCFLVSEKSNFSGGFQIILAALLLALSRKRERGLDQAGRSKLILYRSQPRYLM